MRSSPKRICGFIAPAEASTSPVDEVAQMAGNGRRADVEGDPVRTIVQAWPRGRDRRAVVNRDRDRAPFFEDRALQFGEDGRVDIERVELPLRRERHPHTT